MRLTFLGKDTQGRQLPDTVGDRRRPVRDPGLHARRRSPGSGRSRAGREAVIRVPKKLMRHLKEAREATEL